MTTKAQRIESIKQRLKNTTAGEWTATPDGFVLDEHGDLVLMAPTKDGFNAPDAFFAANAKTDIPWLLKQNDKLQTKIERLEKELECADSMLKVNWGRSILKT